MMLWRNPNRGQIRRPCSGQQGQILIIVALALVGILAVLGLVVDGGLLYVSRRQAQNAADSAALAGAKGLALAGHDEAVTTAFYYANLNGFDNDGVHNGVVVSHPPDAGEFAGNSDFIRVTIAVTNPTYFIHLAYGGPAHTSASSTAGIVPCPPAPSVMTLHPNDCQAFDMRGNAYLRITAGGVIVNSDCADSALYMDGNAQLIADECIFTTGGYLLNGSSVLIQPLPFTGTDPFADPLGSLPAPDISSMPIQHGTAANPSTLRILHGDVTLWPGVYYGGIEILGNADITMEPGTYVMAGGGFRISATGAIVAGDGVCIYNTNDPTNPSGDGAFGPITFSGTSSVTFSPPTEGPYAGVSFFQDRANNLEMYLTGDSVLSSGGGTVYLPAARFHLDGDAVSDTPFISLKFLATGNARMTVRPNFGEGAGGLGSSRVFLAE